MPTSVSDADGQDATQYRRSDRSEEGKFLRDKGQQIFLLGQALYPCFR